LTLVAQLGSLHEITLLGYGKSEGCAEGDEMKHLVVLAAVAFAMALAGTASAGTPPTTPTGYAGACNMLLDPTMLTVAMIKDGGFDSPGSIGMFTATGKSTPDPLCGLG
jgi:hypothetical protein